MSAIPANTASGWIPVVEGKVSMSYYPVTSTYNSYDEFQADVRKTIEAIIYNGNTIVAPVQFAGNTVGFVVKSTVDISGGP